MASLSKRHVIREILRVCCSEIPLNYKEIGERAKPSFVRQVASKYILGYLSPAYLSYNARGKGWTTTPAGVELLSNQDMIDALVGRKPKRKKGRRSVRSTPGYGVPPDLMDTKLLRLRSMIMQSLELSVDGDPETAGRLRSRLMKALEPFVNELTRIYKENSATQVIVAADPRKGIIDTWNQHVKIFLMTLSELPLPVPDIEVSRKESAVDGLRQETKLRLQSLPVLGHLATTKTQPHIKVNPEKTSPFVLPTTDSFLNWQLARIIEIAVDYQLMDIDELITKLTKAAEDLGWKLNLSQPTADISVGRRTARTRSFPATSVITPRGNGTCSSMAFEAAKGTLQRSRSGFTP